LCGTWEPIAPMRRENSEWRTHKGEEYRCGAKGRMGS
jgi:hypothetical protein